ncbi:MAG: hypothetical protein ABII01_04210 [Candidatus Woesearchaeota archaeon]
MANIGELKRIVDQDSQVREALFRYHHDNNRWPGVTEYDAIMNFETEMANPIISRTLVNSFLPEYISNHESDYERRQRRQRRSADWNVTDVTRNIVPSDPYVRRAFGKAATVAAVGLAAILLNDQMVNDPDVHIWVNRLGFTAIAGAAVGYVISYLKPR